MKQCTIVCMLAALALCAGVAHAGGGVVVSVSPSVATVDPGQTFTVNIRIDEAYLLHGSSVVVRFDNSILALADAADGDVYTAVQPGPIFWWRPAAAAGADSVLVDQAILGAATYSGSGALFSLSFTALAPGTSPVTLSYVDLRDNNNQPIAHQRSNGTVTVRSLVANVKAFLQGPYSGSAMLTGLNTAGVIPLAQPYSAAPWSYAGTEAVASIPAGVVDWVLVELRTGTAAATKVAMRAAFIKSNGAVVGLDGASAVGFSGVSAGSYYIVLRHRNHLAVMSAAPVALTTTSAVYDFTAGLGQYYGGEAKELAGGSFGMYAGDVTANGAVVLAQELTVVRANNLQQRYDHADVNMNGAVVLSQELTVVRGNNLRITKVP